MYSTPTYAIQGIPLVDGLGLPVRREINQWAADPKAKKQLDLFLKALKDMQETDHTELLSYFRIAGIHSYPKTAWDGVAYKDRPPPNSKPGFCAHNIAIFATWHRPYMLLFEQHLHTLMLKNIKSWSLSAADAKPWETAAHTFRLPYWDWAQKQPYIKDYGLPHLCTLDEVTVEFPSGKTTFKNPLAGFTNPSGVAFGDKSMGIYAVEDNMQKDKDAPIKGLPWSKCIGTSRYGIFKDKDPSTWAKGVNDWQSVNQVIKKPGWYGRDIHLTFADAVERLLHPGYHKDYKSFACTQYNDVFDKSNKSFLSLEYIHNVAHVSAGGFFGFSKDIDGEDKVDTKGLGHMSDVPVSAFDPVFFLHHCNIDRLLAAWQTFNKDKWFTDDIKPGNKDDLHPFHKDTNGGFWTSEDCQKWTKYGYQYDDLEVTPADNDENGNFSEERYLARLSVWFNILYKGSSNAAQSSPMFLSQDDEFNDYIVNILYDRYALDGQAYSIMLFLGEPPADDKLYQYSEHPNYLGQVYTFSAPYEFEGDVMCGNCLEQKTNRVLSRAQIPVTMQLMQKVADQQAWHTTAQEEGSPQGDPPLGIPDTVEGALDPATVGQIFTQALRVKYVRLGGDVQDPSNFKGTEIALLHAPATFELQTFDDDRAVVPNYGGQYKVLYKQIEGRPTTNQPASLDDADYGFIRDDE